MYPPALAASVNTVEGWNEITRILSSGVSRAICWSAQVAEFLLSWYPGIWGALSHRWMSCVET